MLLLSVTALSQPTPTPAGGDIAGTLKSGNLPLPGVTVSAANSLTGQKVITSTDLNGAYSLHVPANGRYVVRAEMAAFAAATHEVVINAENRSARMDLEMTLLSRAQQANQQQAQAAQAGRGMQNLALLQSVLGGQSESQASNGGEQGLPTGLQVPGMSQESATESVSMSGNVANPSWGNLSSDALRQRIQEIREQHQGEGGGPPRGGLQVPGANPAAARNPGAPGGPGGFGGGGPMMIMGGRGRFNFNRPHGTIYYSGDNAALDASPYSLTGIPQSKPAYMQNRFGGALGGPLIIPKIYNGGQKTFFFVNYNGTRAQNPFDQFSTVPADGSFGTVNERAGIFTGVTDRQGNPITLVNPNLPQCQQPNPCIQNNQVRTINPSAQALLNYIPHPNQPGYFKNFHFITSAANNIDDFNIRLIHAFGKSILGPQRTRGGGGRNNLNIGFHYRSAETDLTNAFPSVGGSSTARAFDIPIGYVRSFGKLTNNLRFDFNRNRLYSANLYAFVTDVAGDGGITGVSQNPFDWGIPNLSFTNFSSLNDTTPLLHRDQTLTFSDFMIWSHGKHTWRWGGDFRRIELSTETSSNPRGSFTFTGVNTGLDFADFLVGLPQLSTAQFGINNYHFRGNSWDLFTQDEYRVRGNLTLNLGLRYEYISPFSEINNLIANLTFVPGLPLGLPAVPVLPAGTNPQLCAVYPCAIGSSPYAGALPSTLVHPDRNNFAPRIGIAWKPFAKTVVRAGYGINYNTSAYTTIVQQLGFQPPFTFTQTNRECLPTVPSANCLAQSQLMLGFSAAAPTTVTNNYGVDPNYRMCYVQIWNLNVQRELGKDLLLNVDYTGTKGTRLDVLEAPNRTASGLANDLLPVFYFETSAANSIAHAGTVRLRKRLRHGVSIGGSYNYSKSIDDASSIGSGANIVAQNAANIAAERGLSVFDQRHRFVADYLLELPFGHDKRWLYRNGPLRSVFGDWQLSGNWTIASGFPFTPRVLGSITDVNSGTNGTLRADLTGEPIAIANATVSEWFNTGAFVAPPVGSFGTAGRDMIEGPGSVIFDMAITKVIPLGDVRMLEFRMQATDVFNTPQFTAIDTTVNSPTFGQVTTVGSMRKVLAQARFRF